MRGDGRGATQKQSKQDKQESLTSLRFFRGINILTGGKGVCIAHARSQPDLLKYIARRLPCSAFNNRSRHACK